MKYWGRTVDTLHATALISHALCCGLPLAMNLFALAFGAGVLGTSLPWAEGVHGALHEHEATLLVISGVLVLIGGAAQFLSWRAERRQRACGHDACERPARRRIWVFAAVVALFSVNSGLLIFGHGRGETTVAEPRAASSAELRSLPDGNVRGDLSAPRGPLG